MIDKNELRDFQKTLTVLYLDDDEAIRNAMTSVLNNLFFEVVFASNGKEGLEIFSQNPKKFDLILSDISMPIMDGIEMGKYIREINTKIPIIFITAFSDSTRLLEAISIGIDGYIVKPIQFKSFMKTVGETAYKLYLEKQNLDYKQNLQQKVLEQTQDIQAKNEELKYKFYHDQLTNLKNIYAFYDDISKASHPRMMLIDINKFSTFNNMYGWDIGDEILRNFAQRLIQCKHNTCTAYRLSADQFVLTNNSVKELNWEHVAHKLLAKLTDMPICILLNNEKIDINLMVTIAVVDNVEHKNILEYADMALKYAKQTHQPFIMYSSQLNKQTQYKKALDAIGLVKTALANDTLVPFFQPIIKSNYVSYECLVRIIKDDKIITPYFFIDDIKHTSYYTELTKTVINKSFEYFKDKPNMFSINLSFEDILNTHIVDYLKEKLHNNPISSRVIIEILESESIDNFDIVKDFVTQMKKLNVKIAIDDFGSGYSNFVYLQELCPDYLKIDGSLIKDVDTNKTSQIIVKTIISFAQQLGIKVIAEYIHNESVYKTMLEYGVYGLQGYYLGEPSNKLLPNN